MTGWHHALAVYRDPRVLSILFFGFASGLPRGLVGGTLSAWLTEAGVSLTAVGFMGTVALVYSLKFLWAPVMDRVPLPVLSARFGRRRSWTLVTQAGLMAGLLALGAFDPAENLARTAVLAVIVAFLSASQDIVIDAYRVEILRREQYGAGAGMVQFGYNGAMLVTGFGSLYVAQFLSWSWVYPAAAALMLVGVVAVLLNPEPKVEPVPVSGNDRESWFQSAVIEPFSEMFRRNRSQILMILAFILLYKVGDSFAGAAATPFYLKMGFTKVEIANVSKVFGVIATISGTLIGGILVARIGIMRALLLCGVLQMGSNLTFAWLAMVGPDIRLLYLAIAVENVSGGMGSAAFVAYLSGLCNLSYTGTQYALLSSTGTLVRNGVANSWGAIVESVGWFQFFVLTTGFAIPGLVLLAWMMWKVPKINPRGSGGG